MEEAEQLAGVGIFFKQNESKHPVVESLLPTGSAERAGGVEVGDVLIKVGNVLCERLSMERIRSLVCGPIGSYVSMAFRRQGLDGSFFYYEIQLVRGTRQYLDLLERFAFCSYSQQQLRNMVIRSLRAIDIPHLHMQNQKS